MPLLAYEHVRRTGHAGGRVRFAKLFPLFILGFLAMAIARSIGDAKLASGGLAWGVWDAASWKQLANRLAETCGSAALGTAMAGVGLSTNLRAFWHMGMKPFYVGALSAVLVGGLALLLASVVGPHL